VLAVFKGEKTTVFWIGIVALAYSISQFCIAGWQIFYYYFLFPIVSFNISASEAAAFANSVRLQAFSQLAIPSIITGVIFLVIGLYLMKIGFKKNLLQTQTDRASSELVLDS
jgi:hypothetical protein